MGEGLGKLDDRGCGWKTKLKNKNNFKMTFSFYLCKWNFLYAPFIVNFCEATGTEAV